jgi:hypothetical protein
MVVTSLEFNATRATDFLNLTMKTPAGKECRYFYGDYYRGRNQEECRLLQSARPALLWSAELCKTCPVPAILMANACPHMVLEPRLTRPFPFIKRQVEIRTACERSKGRDFDPHIGCGECHQLPPIFLGDSS